MADVQIQQTPDRGSSAWVWVILVIVLLGIIAWFVFGGAMGGERGGDVDVNIEAPAEGGGAGAGAATPPPSP